MLSVAIMTIVIVISIIQLLHHMNLMDDILPGITHMFNNYPIDTESIRKRIFFSSLKGEHRDAMQPCWNIDKPCWPEDEPNSGKEVKMDVTQAVVRANGGWYNSILYYLYACKSAFLDFPMLTSIALATCMIYATHLGNIMRVLPKPAEEHFRALLNLMESTHKEIQSKSSQTSQHLISDIYSTLENQESRSLEVVMDILNEMNEGLTMQQWYEQEKLNIMMEDDLRASRTSSKFSETASDVNRLMRDLCRYNSKREHRLTRLKESKKRAETAFQKCYTMLGDLEGVRDMCDDTIDKRFPPVR